MREAGPAERPNPAEPPAIAPAPPDAAPIGTDFPDPGDESATPAASTGRDPEPAGAPEPPAGQASPGDGADDPGPPPGDAGAADTSSLRAGTAAPEPGPAFDDALLRGIAAAPSVSSSDGAGPAAGASAIPVAVPDRDDDAEEPPPRRRSPAADPAFDESPPGGIAGPPDAAADPLDAVHGDIPLEAAPPGPAAALAFAADHDTEVALRDGLFGYRSASPGCGDPQVWQGGLRAAIAALGEGHSAPLVFVDIDGIPYPAGAMHELAAVCEEGTVVVAVGSDGTARPGRELLLAGVSDYLAKPLTADAVRAATGRAAAQAIENRPGGRVAGFVGSGGSGTTTLVSAAALHAAERGCYVSVLDLNRSVAAAALALGIEPAAGLDQLLEAAGQAMAEPEMVEGVCARRSDRIEVYAHPWTPTPPAAPFPAAVDRVLAALRLRSQLVLVDGLDESEMRFDAPSEVDTRVFVAEPTAGKAAHLPRMLDMLGKRDSAAVRAEPHARIQARCRRARAPRCEPRDRAGRGGAVRVLAPGDDGPRLARRPAAPLPPQAHGRADRQAAVPDAGRRRCGLGARTRRVVTMAARAFGRRRSGARASGSETAARPAAPVLPAAEQAGPQRHRARTSVAISDVVARVHPTIVKSLDMTKIGDLDNETLAAQLLSFLESGEAGLPDLSPLDRQQVVTQLVHDIKGLGPIEPLLMDPLVSDILINGMETSYVERRGQLERVDLRFRDAQHLLHVAQRIAGWVGRRVDESSPMVDARLPDGSRVNIIIPPLAIDGAAISIRRFTMRGISLEDMAERQAMSAAMAELFRVCVRARLNILVSGGTGSGKTTFMNALSQKIDHGERLVTIEDAAELQLQQPHVVRLETRTMSAEGTGQVTMRDLLVNTLRMRPDRIIVGEVRGGEATEMLQAMNTGHPGSMCTLHANSPRDALIRLENMLMMAGADMPLSALRRQIASSVDIVVQLARLRSGHRCVTSVTNVVGIENDIVTTEELWRRRPTGDSQHVFETSGRQPSWMEAVDAVNLREPLMAALQADPRIGEAGT